MSRLYPSEEERAAAEKKAVECETFQLDISNKLSERIDKDITARSEFLAQIEDPAVGPTIALGESIMFQHMWREQLLIGSLTETCNKDAELLQEVIIFIKSLAARVTKLEETK